MSALTPKADILGIVAENVKGCRTPAVSGWLPRSRSAGVGQASGEETAGRLGSVFRLEQPMGIWMSGDGFGASEQRLDDDGLDGWRTGAAVIGGRGSGFDH